MIKKLRARFVLLATVSILALMTVLVVGMNLINYTSVAREADDILSVLANMDRPFGEMRPDFGLSRPMDMSPETLYESRCFTVTMSSDGELIDADISRIVSVGVEAAESYGRRALSRHSDRGFTGRFRYLKLRGISAVRIVFLDCGRRLDSFFAFLRISSAIGFLGCVIVFLFFLVGSKRLLRPIAESYTKQKRFITDAGHEIKTPLTIIGANIDLLEADYGENESLTDIRQQTAHLRELTDELVYLSRMEENAGTMEKVEFPLSDLVLETAMEFKAPATAQGKIFRLGITPNLSMNGSQESIRRLLSVLIDNAMKYSPRSGEIYAELSAARKNIVLTVTNTTAETVSPDNIAHVFDRFYRADSSRNSETGGHGIGLSIAQAIVSAHGGRISAETRTGREFIVTVQLPI